MTYLLYIIGLSIAFYGKIYVMKHKKNLSDENLIEFEKKLKPKIIKFIIFSFFPVFLFCFYLISGPTQINIWYFIICALVMIILNIFGYINSKKTINHSQNSEHFKYILNYFIFMGSGFLFILSATAYSLKDYLVY